MSDYLDPNNEELLKDYFSEAEAQVEILEQNILVLENDPKNSDAVDEIFRAAHTLKGNSATVQMTELAEFTHVMEDVLDEIRSGAVSVSGDIVDVLLSSIDIIKAMLAARASGGIYAEDISQVEDALHAFLPGDKKAQRKPQQKKEEPKPKAAPQKIEQPQGGLSEYEILELRETAGAGKSIYKVSVQLDESNPMNTVSAIQVFAVLKEMGQVLRTVPEFESLYEDNFYPVVDYYIATQKSKEEIRKKLVIPDVTKGAEITDLQSGYEKPQAEPATPAPQPVSAAREQKPTQQAVEAEKAAVKEEEEEVQDDKQQKLRDQDAKKQKTQGSVLRVDSRRIDNLINLVSEIVINKATFNQISGHFSEILLELQNSETLFREKMKTLFDSLPDYLERIQQGTSVKDVKKELMENYGSLFTIFDQFEGRMKTTVGKLKSSSQNLGRITGELQEGVMRIRMVPISQIFSRFPRLVRDLSKTLNKNVELHIEGEETELDKSVIEDLLDPLIHCVRNSIDHGVENPDERKAAGKPEVGRVLLKASNEGNMIVIEISDDGKGIDVETVRKKAIERGIIHPSKTLSDIEAFNLIFEPGFSTAKTVTNISGRGVGLDVVRKSIDKLNGTVSVWSEKGKGTKLTIKLPLTLAIIQGLLVRVGKEIYVIPITSVIDSHRVKPSEIRMIDNYEVFNVRDDVISLIRLNRIFKIPATEKKDYYFIVIVGSGDKKMGLMVDSLIGEEDVVIKPLKDQYTTSPGIAGANILGDGTISLIIDVSQLIELGLKKELEERRKREATIW